MSDTPARGSAVVYAHVRPGFTRGKAAPEANAPAVLERKHLNFDGVEGATEVRGYKHLRSLWPIGSVTDPADPLIVSVGASDSAGREPAYYTPAQPFDGEEGTEELFYQSHGRFHSIRVEYTGDGDFRLSRIDLDLTKQGDR